MVCVLQGTEACLECDLWVWTGQSLKCCVVSGKLRFTQLTKHFLNTYFAWALWYTRKEAMG